MKKYFKKSYLIIFLFVTFFFFLILREKDKSVYFTNGLIVEKLFIEADSEFPKFSSQKCDLPEVPMVIRGYQVMYAPGIYAKNFFGKLEKVSSAVCVSEYGFLSLITYSGDRVIIRDMTIEDLMIIPQDDYRRIHKLVKSKKADLIIL